MVRLGIPSPRRLQTFPPEITSMQIPSDSTTPIYSIYENDECFGDLVELFVQEMPQRVEVLQSNASPGLWAELKRYAHQLKGSAGSYGFGSITDLAAALEAALSDHSNEEAVLERLAALVEACQRVRFGDPSRTGGAQRTS